MIMQRHQCLFPAVRQHSCDSLEIKIQCRYRELAKGDKNVTARVFPRKAKLERALKCPD